MTDMSKRVAEIMRMGRGALRDLWRETFGEEPRSGNVVWMRKRLCWGVQASVLGGLSEVAKQRIEELTPIALASMPWGRRSFPQGNATVPPPARPRLSPGTTLTRPYKGRTLVALVRDDGSIEFDGKVYASLTAAAKAATGSHWNGTLFWLGRGDRKRRSA